MWKVPLFDASFGPEEKEAVLEVLASGWISMGPTTERFESEFARMVGARHGVAVCSCTAALHLALLAAGIGPRCEIIVPSLTFVATVNAVLYTGATPVFADITGLDDWTISSREIQAKITGRTKGMIVMHYGGYPCDMEGIRSIAKDHGLKLIEDAAHAPGAHIDGRMLGTWGDLGCFSFFSNKNITTAEGGMIVTDDGDTSKRLRNLRSHGMTTLTWDRHKGHGFSYDVTDLGYNYRLDEIRAALGLVQLSRLPQYNAKRREITRSMRESLRRSDQLTIPFPDELIGSASCHIFPVLLESGVDRSRFMAYMKEAGIQTSIHYPPVHRFSAYSGRFLANLPLTDEVASREVTLPLFPGMTEEQIELVCETALRAAEACRS